MTLFEKQARQFWPEIDLSMKDGEYTNTQTRWFYFGWTKAMECVREMEEA